MNISALNAPATPPYDYQNHTSMDNNNDNNKNYSDIFLDRHPSPDHHHIETSSTTSDNETIVSNHSAFRRVLSISMPSPPELLIDTSEDDEEEETASYTSSSTASFNNMHYKSNNNRKSVPHRSPSNIIDHKSVIFQIEANRTPKILGGGGNNGSSSLLWSLRQRVSMARRQQRNHKNRLSAPRPERRVRAMRIQIPRPTQQPHHQRQQQQSPTPNTIYDDFVSPASNHHPYQHFTQHANNEPHYHHRHEPVTIIHNSIETTATATIQPMAIVEPTSSSWQNVKKSNTGSAATNGGKQAIDRKKTSANVAAATPRKNCGTHHASSGRPSRVKGPCQACHETSDGCMRKAFNWPFLTSTIFNDKGKAFVYLCNKCGLRYNKSGGCVCRHCRWVLCKEEKRKAMQLIDQMRRSRPDGRVDPEEDIENFACSPKYWSCGRPWKVGWVLNSQHDDDEEDMMMDNQSSSSPSLSEATL